MENSANLDNSVSIHPLAVPPSPHAVRPSPLLLQLSIVCSLCHYVFLFFGKLLGQSFHFWPLVRNNVVQKYVTRFVIIIRTVDWGPEEPSGGKVAEIP